MKEVAERDIIEAIEQFKPSAQIKQKEDLSGHNNRIFKIDLEGRTIICKFSTGENRKQDCEKEVNMHHLLRKQTTIKTPKILYSNCSTDRTEYPFFIAEHIQGGSLQDIFSDLSAEGQTTIVKQAGQILGEAHSKIYFQHAGELEADKNSIGVDRECTWVDYITTELDNATDKSATTRFSDLKEKAENLVAKISEMEEPNKTVVFYDFRPDNTIADKDKIKALIDFERALSGDPLWDYAYSEMSFIEPHRYFTMHENPKADGEKLRKVFQEEYSKKRALSENWREKVVLYKLGILVKRFNSFNTWTRGVGMSKNEIKRQEELVRKNFNRLYNKSIL